MLLCSGPPSGPCPLKINDSTVSFCIADVFQCPACLLVRFPSSKNTAHVSELRESRALPSWIPVAHNVSKCIGNKENKSTQTAIHTSSADRNTMNVKPVTYKQSKHFPTAQLTFVHKRHPKHALILLIKTLHRPHTISREARVRDLPRVTAHVQCACRCSKRKQ